MDGHIRALIYAPLRDACMAQAGRPWAVARDTALTMTDSEVLDSFHQSGSGARRMASMRGMTVKDRWSTRIPDISLP